MEKTFKEFIVGKDTCIEDVQLNCGDIALILPIEFFDTTEPKYREDLESCGIDVSSTVDLNVFAPEEYEKMHNSGDFHIKYSTPVNVFDLAHLFYDLEISVKDITVQADD